MRVKDSSGSFGAASVVNHWLTAVIVIGTIALGLYMADLPRGPDKLQWIGIHKSIGIVVLTLALFRLLWRVVNPLPGLSGTSPLWQRKTARVVQFTLMALLILLPVSGWIMSSAGGHPVDVFGWFTLPALIEKNKAVGGFFHEFHEVLAWILISLVSLHFLAAVKHHFIDRDATLKRMAGLESSPE